MTRSRRSILAEGWRLYVAHERSALPTRRRVRVIVVGALVSIAGSALASRPPVVDSSRGTTWSVVGSLALGTLVGCLAALVAVLIEARRQRRTVEGVEPSRFWNGVTLADGVWKEIGDAYREGREPTSSIDERIKAVQVAETQRLVQPTQVRLGLAFAPIIVPIVALMFASPTFALILGPIYWAAYSVVRVAMSLWMLGHTTAVIESAPEIPEGYTPAPTKKRGWVPPKPYRQLGTSNPDDYSRD